MQSTADIKFGAARIKANLDPSMCEYSFRMHSRVTALMLGRLFSMFTLFFLYCYFDSPCLSVSLLAFKDMMGFSYWSYKKYKKVFFFPFSQLGR